MSLVMPSVGEILSLEVSPVTELVVGVLKSLLRLLPLGRPTVGGATGSQLLEFSRFST